MRMRAQLTSRRFAPLAAVVVALAVAAACGRGSGYARSETASSNGALAAAPDTAITIRGTVASVSSTDLVVKADTGSVTVKLTQPLQLFTREPGKLDDVKNDAFIGVTTIKQPDGSEKATEIHVFPEELRGLGEGSRMMAPTASGGGGRMTNGAVTAPRMSNGKVADVKGSTLVVQYAGGSQQVVVPSNTPVTEIKSTSKSLTPGDQIVILAKRSTDGSLSATKAILAGK